MAARAIGVFSLGIAAATATAHNANNINLAVFDHPQNSALSWLGSNLSLVGRSFRALATFAAIAIDLKWSTFQLESASQEYQQAREAVHGRAASRMLQVAQVNGGVYIKAGQFISAQTHIPEVYRKVLSVLQDRVAERSLAAISTTIVEELGPLSTIFASFDPHPVATASLAQVHRAVDISGKLLAVKIQHPELRRNVEVDIDTFKLLSFLSNRVFDAFDVDWLVPEFALNIRKEVDFMNEGCNCERAAANFKGASDVAFPTIYWNLTTARVLTMSWEGEQALKVSDIAGIVALRMDPAEVAELMLKSFGMMMFEHGFVHADPHPGNLLVRRSPRISSWQRVTCALKKIAGLDVSHAPQLVILDHGLYVDIPFDVRRDWCLLWRSLVLGQRKILADVSNRLMPSGGSILTAALSFGSRHLQLDEDEKQKLRERFKNFSMSDFIELLQELPRPLLLAFRSQGLIRNNAVALGVDDSRRVALQALGACEGLLELEAHDSNTSTTKFAALNAKYWLALLQYWWFTIQIRFKVLAFASIFHLSGRKAHSAVPAAAPGLKDVG